MFVPGRLSPTADDPLPNPRPAATHWPKTGYFRLGAVHKCEESGLSSSLPRSECLTQTHPLFITTPTLTTMSSAPLTREQVKNLKPSQVHETLGRKLLVDGFDVVTPPRPRLPPFSSPLRLRSFPFFRQVRLECWQCLDFSSANFWDSWLLRFVIFLYFVVGVLAPPPFCRFCSALSFVQQHPLNPFTPSFVSCHTTRPTMAQPCEEK